MPRYFEDASSSDGTSDNEASDNESEPSENENEGVSDVEEEEDREDLSHLTMYDRMQLLNERNVASAHSMKPDKKSKRIPLQYELT